MFLHSGDPWKSRRSPSSCKTEREAYTLNALHPWFQSVAIFPFDISLLQQSQQRWHEWSGKQAIAHRKGQGPARAGQKLSQVQQMENPNPNTQCAQLLMPPRLPSRPSLQSVNAYRKHSQLPFICLQAFPSHTCWSGDLGVAVKLWFRLLLIRMAKHVFVVGN